MAIVYSILTWFLSSAGESYQRPVQAKRVVCYACEGEGTELRGGLKGAVFSGEEVEDWDEDFRENYFGGTFDVPCSTCKGKSVLDVVDWDALTEKEKEDYERQQNRESMDAAEAADERRRGC